MTNENIETKVKSENRHVIMELVEDVRLFYKLHKEISQYGGKEDHEDNYAVN